MKYAIRLYSKYTGDLVACLGSKFESYKAAQAYADKEVCRRCNRVEIDGIADDAQWKGRLTGFQWH